MPFRATVQLEVRLRQDVILKYQCGFDLRKSSPDESTLAKFAQFLGQHLAALQAGHAGVRFTTVCITF